MAGSRPDRYDSGKSPMIESLLIANRGEIACRIIRTALRMGVRTIAVCSAADRNALHTPPSDEVVTIGPASSRASSLNVRDPLQATPRPRTEGAPPGYGFPSAHAQFP